MRKSITQPVSFEGSAHINVGVEENHSRRHPYTRHSKVGKPQAWDAVKPGTCWHCGLVGPHPSRDDCITALRELLAKLEH
jgi:hypothetical protein